MRAFVEIFEDEIDVDDYMKKIEEIKLENKDIKVEENKII